MKRRKTISIIAIVTLYAFCFTQLGFAAPDKLRESNAGASGSRTAASIGNALAVPKKETVQKWVKITELPHDFAQSLTRYGISVEYVEVLRLKGVTEPSKLFNEPGADFAIQTSLSQSLGSILFAGGGKAVKEIADANAVYLGDKSIRTYTQNHQNEAIVIMGDEGSRDNSASLQMGSIYFHDWGLRTYNGLSDLNNHIAVLQARGIQIYYFVGDALEATNGLIDPRAVKEATNSWSLAAVFDTMNYLVNDNFRIGGISYYAATDAGVTPFDLPSAVLRKLARAQGIRPNMAAYDDFVSKHKILMLGPRELKKDYELGLTGHKHQALIEDAKMLKEKYPGLQILLPGDGDLMPRIISSLGLSLNDDAQMITFGRSGAVEATAAMIPAINDTHGGQFAHSYVSKASTDTDYNKATAHQYDSEEEGWFAELNIPYQIYTKQLSKHDIRGKGVLAITSVTGASEEIFGASLANALQRINFTSTDKKSGTIITNTFVVTRDGSAFIVRTHLNTNDLDKTKNGLNNASPEAQVYLETAAGIGNALGVTAQAMGADELEEALRRDFYIVHTTGGDKWSITVYPRWPKSTTWHDVLKITFTSDFNITTNMTSHTLGDVRKIASQAVPILQELIYDPKCMECMGHLTRQDLVARIYGNLRRPIADEPILPLVTALAWADYKQMWITDETTGIEHILNMPLFTASVTTASADGRVDFVELSGRAKIIFNYTAPDGKEYSVWFTADDNRTMYSNIDFNKGKFAAYIDGTDGKSLIKKYDEENMPGECQQEMKRLKQICAEHGSIKISHGKDYSEITTVTGQQKIIAGVSNIDERLKPKAELLVDIVHDIFNVFTGVHGWMATLDGLLRERSLTDSPDYKKFAGVYSEINKIFEERRAWSHSYYQARANTPFAYELIIKKGDKYVQEIKNGFSSANQSILADTQVMDRLAGGSLKDLLGIDSAEFAQTISEECARGIEMLDDYQAEDGNKKYFDAKEAVDKIFSAFEKLTNAQKLGISFTVDADAGIKSGVYMNPARFQRVIRNLITNSMRFIKDNGRITAILSNENGILVIRMNDNGSGIPETIEREKLFQPGVSSKSARPGAIKGRGLSICKTYLGEVNGNIELEKTDKSGTTFKITLPLTAASAQGQAAADANGDIAKNLQEAGLEYNGEAEYAVILDCTAPKAAANLKILIENIPGHAQISAIVNTSQEAKELLERGIIAASIDAEGRPFIDTVKYLRDMYPNLKVRLYTMQEMSEIEKQTRGLKDVELCYLHVQNGISKGLFELINSIGLIVKKDPAKLDQAIDQFAALLKTESAAIGRSL